MKKHDSAESQPVTARPEATRVEQRDASKPAPKIDFAKLDLTVEKVEERISPSETNVFDK